MLTMKDWPKLEEAYKKTVDEIKVVLVERAKEKEETKLRSIPVERGGRYLIILEHDRPIPQAEHVRVIEAMDALNHWLTEENTPFMGLDVFCGITVRFERVKVAEDEAEQGGDDELQAFL